MVKTFEIDGKPILSIDGEVFRALSETGDATFIVRHVIDGERR